MADASNFQTQIEIKDPTPSTPPPPPPPPFATEFPPENVPKTKVPFFKSRYRRRRGDTWLISVFVILHIIAFVSTMVVNDCSRRSYGDCALKALGRFSFQPLSENPLLGPAASTLDNMGALRRKEHLQTWRLFTFSCLHAGVIHLVINLFSVVFIGIHMEQEFGPLRVGIIYVLSAFAGTLVAALFVEKTPEVGSSGALYGLLGAMLSGLIRYWRMYTNKFAALATLFFVCIINFSLGLLPYIDNFSSVGGFLSGFLLGFVLLFSPQINQVSQTKGGLFEYSIKTSIKLKLKEKLDRPSLRIVSLLLFSLLVAGCLVAVIRDINMNQYCQWCRYVDCVPLEEWSCRDKVTSCETMVSNEQLTLTCLGNGHYRVFPFTNMSESRINDLCSVIC
ncbi:RHOMBOID-like protein 8 [Ziziphus jujuba]|uniref:RHOMBOID-like protein n=1 Tax=Ziziphus jujuba TaxID=326968 RepID=A0A6P3ZZA8_ZIZJJ|nr:RHOMBOID-like protein 8 [Ziziphus jujuba]